MINILSPTGGDFGIIALCGSPPFGCRIKSSCPMETFEIRDTRNGEWHWVNNAVIACPHITSAEKVVYSALCTFAGCQEIRPDFELIAERASVSIRTAKIAIKKLIKVGYIIKLRGGGRGVANVYELLKAAKGCKICTVYKGCKKRQETVQISPIKGAKSAPQLDKELDKEIDKSAANAAGASKTNEPMTVDEFVSWCRKSPQRHINIIGEYADEVKPAYNTYGQWQSFIKRNLRAAKNLEPYTDAQITEAMNKILKADYITKHTLETLLKFV